MVENNLKIMSSFADLSSSNSTNPRTFPLSSEEDVSAVHKVVRTTELLESILKYLPFVGEPELPDRGRCTANNRPWRYITDMPRPRLQRLFAVQRVNREFRDTIVGSLELQRLMLLEPIREVEGLLHDVDAPPHGLTYHQEGYQHSPLHWFSSVCLEIDLDEPDEMVNTFTTSLAGYTIEDPPWDREEASWRRVRINQYKNGDPVTLLVYLALEFSSKKYDDEIEVRYTEALVFNADASMGELYDAVLELGCRSLEEHTQAMLDQVAEGY